jgi:hypothetical protein
LNVWLGLYFSQTITGDTISDKETQNAPKELFPEVTCFRYSLPIPSDAQDLIILGFIYNFSVLDDVGIFVVAAMVTTEIRGEAKRNCSP